ncbi:MAG: metal-dependent transcriptional regulator [Puniceicoccales bacterium]|jgi:DtxR family Mn-dependent transcriptional regulator|nr:metal-dependent transcriptional regulator [Puniceicoccales bacterium]
MVNLETARVSLTSSQENYLKTICMEVSQNGYAKMSDIADLLSVKKSSVNAALNVLADKNLINYKPYSQITLTPLGFKKAKEIIKRFEVMYNFFCEILKLSREEAVANSCRMEHAMSEELFRRIDKFCEFTKEVYGNDPNYRKRLDELLS